MRKNSLAPGTWQRDHDQLHGWVPDLGKRPIAAIEAPELLDVLKRVEAKGISDTAHRRREVCGRVFQWRIPAERMKMGKAHVVPLARQSVAILRELRPITGRGRYTFPAIAGGGRPLSENTLNGALRRLGYTGEQMTAHGFRSVASTLLNERGVHPDLIELQLAHAERNKVRAAYNRAQRLAERREMMQA